MLITDQERRAERERRGIDDGVDHSQLVLEAHRRGSQCKMLAERDHGVSKGLPQKHIGRRLGISFEQNRCNFVERDGGNPQDPASREMCRLLVAGTMVGGERLKLPVLLNVLKRRFLLEPIAKGGRFFAEFVGGTKGF
jgi:hypothetical protein